MLKYFLALLGLFTGLHADPATTTAVTYNIRYDARSDRGARDWDARKSTVIKYLMNKNASLIGLQEVTHGQLQDLQKALKNHHSIGVGREDGKTRGEYSPIFYDTRAWRSHPNEQGTFWLSDTPDIVGSKSWGNSVTRICTWARLTHTQTHQSIYVYNTHWDHRSQNSREHAAKLILQKINTRTHADEPFILMGDFNATTDNPAIKTLLSSQILTDPGKQQFHTFNHWQPTLIPGKRIDHIFVSKHWENTTLRVESAEHLKGKAASDHHPVTLTGTLHRD